MDDNQQQLQADPPEYAIDKCEALSLIRELSGSSLVEWTRMSMPIVREHDQVRSDTQSHVEGG